MTGVAGGEVSTWKSQAGESGPVKLAESMPWACQRYLSSGRPESCVVKSPGAWAPVFGFPFGLPVPTSAHGKSALMLPENCLFGSLIVARSVGDFVDTKMGAGEKQRNTREPSSTWVLVGCSGGWS